MAIEIRALLFSGLARGWFELSKALAECRSGRFESCLEWLGKARAHAPKITFGDPPAYLTLSPELKQVFFIGDGLNGNGLAQSVVVPQGATRLFLGTMDSVEWNNNVGSFTVQVVPEPSALAAAAALAPLLARPRRPLRPARPNRLR